MDDALDALDEGDGGEVAAGPGDQKKYGDDKQRAQVETMALYNTTAIRPLAGCAPISSRSDLERAVHHAVGDRRALPPSRSSRAGSRPTNTDSMYILPVALFITMFAQARLNPQSANSAGQKMIAVRHAIMFGFMSFYFPSGRRCTSSRTRCSARRTRCT